MLKRILETCLHWALPLSVALVVFWAAGILLHSLHASIAWRISLCLIWIVSAGITTWRLKPIAEAIGVVLLGSFLITVFWLFAHPATNRDWLASQRILPSAQIGNDAVILTDLQSANTVNPNEATTLQPALKLDLRKLQGLDLIIRGDWTATTFTPVLSFDFADEGHVCLSVQPRLSVGDEFTALGHLFRRYEQIMTVENLAATLDRSMAVNKQAEIYLYHLKLTPGEIRSQFEQCIDRLNKLHATPQWFGLLASSTLTRQLFSVKSPSIFNALDLRRLFPSRADTLLQSDGLLGTDLNMETFRQRSLLAPATLAGLGGLQLSERVRQRIGIVL